MHKVRVERIDNAASGIIALKLVPVDGTPVDPYRAGAHIDVAGPSGIVRQYSLCHAPDDTSGYLIAVKREASSRGGSASLHDDVAVGTELSVGEPRNLFALAEDATEHLLFAGGIGITPLLSMAYTLREAGSRFHLHYFARSTEHAAFRDVLSASGFVGNVTFHIGLSREAIDVVLESAMQAADPGAHVYTCGPSGFMNRVVTTAEARLGEDAVHLEHFEADPSQAESATDSFEAMLAKSGKIVQVPAGVSLVDALRDAGCDIDTECREGICGTCIVPVLEGEPDHRDNCLSKKEKASHKKICVCVSRAKGQRIVLDI